LKIFLCGGGDGTQSASAYRHFADVIDSTKPLLYIPLAMERTQYPDCYRWITAELTHLHLPGIKMVQSASELERIDLNRYCALFIGGGNTYKLLWELKAGECFEKISRYIRQGGVVFGSSAGAIIFGGDLESCQLDDANDIGLTDTTGFDLLDGACLLCHYTNRTPEKDEASTRYLIQLSARKKVIALPEEDTLYINGEKLELIGTRPWYIFENGVRIRREGSSI